VPFKVMEVSLKSFEVIKTMANSGNPNSVTDAGVGALCARAAIRGAFLNVQINCGDLKDKKYVANVLKQGKRICQQAEKAEKDIMKIVDKKM